MPLDPSRAYRVLGLEPGASSEDVKNAYRDLVQVWHPDRFAAGTRLYDKAQKNLKRINEAYAVLKDYQPPPQPEPRRVRDSITAILGMGDLRESGGFRAPERVFRRSLRVVGINLPEEGSGRRPLRWVLGLAVLLLVAAGILVGIGALPNPFGQ